MEEGLIIETGSGLKFIPTKAIMSICGSGDNFTVFYGRGGYCARESCVRLTELARRSYGEFIQKIHKNVKKGKKGVCNA